MAEFNPTGESAAGEQPGNAAASFQRRQDGAPGGADGGPRFVLASDLLAEAVSPRPWLVRDMIPAGQVTELRGDGGTGKSTLALQLCACAASGLSWLDRPVERGPAIYLASEDDAGELRRRLNAIAVHLQLAPEALADLHLWPLATDDPALVVLSHDGLNPTPRWSQLVARVEAVRPTVVVLDSRADVFAGEEMNRHQVQAFVALLRGMAVRSGAAVMVLAHPSHTGMMNRTGNSGSTHWTNAVRSALYLSRPDDKDGSRDPDVRMLGTVKANYSRTGAALSLRWSAGAFVVVNGGAPPSASRQEAEGRAEQVFLDLLDVFTVEGRHVHHAAGKNYAPAVFAKDPRGRGLNTLALKGAMDRLFVRGEIVAQQVGPPSRLRTRLMRNSAS